MACLWRSYGGVRKLVQKHRLLSTSIHVQQKIINPDDAKTHEVKKQLDIKDKQLYWEYHQKDKGQVYDKKPFKMECKEGKVYMWCSCGYSKRQPFCDGTHKITHYRIKLKPVPFVCKETKEYWFCNCKQTNHRPFCDGTHRGQEVQETHAIVKD